MAQTAQEHLKVFHPDTASPCRLIRSRCNRKARFLDRVPTFDSQFRFHRPLLLSQSISRYNLRVHPNILIERRGIEAETTPTPNLTGKVLVLHHITALSLPIIWAPSRRLQVILKMEMTNPEYPCQKRSRALSYLAEKEPRRLCCLHCRLHYMKITDREP